MNKRRDVGSRIRVLISRYDKDPASVTTPIVTCARNENCDRGL